MSVNKENALHEILEQFNAMVQLVKSQLNMMEKMLNSGALVLNEQTVSEMELNEIRIDEFETAISEKIIDIIVLQKPVASELRKIMATYQMISNLERIGDQVKNIIKAMPKINDEEVYSHMAGVISNMMMSSIIMVEKSIESFVNNDNEAAIWTIKNDDVIDEINHKLIKETINKSKFSEKTQQLLFTFIGLNNIISNIERIADHATNIAEASIYSNSGENLRHNKAKGIQS
jgi:phosphate transport system protein